MLIKKFVLIFGLLFLLISSGCATKNNLVENNQKIVAAYYAAYNKQDITGQIALMAPEFKHFQNSGKVEIGTDAYRKYTAAVYTEVKEEVYQIDYIVGQDPMQIAAQSRARGEYFQNPDIKTQRQKYDIPLAEFFEVRDGKITKLSTYYNELEWENQVKKK